MDVARDFIAATYQLAFTHIQHDRRLSGNEDREVLEIALRSKASFFRKALCQGSRGTGLSHCKVNALRLPFGDAAGKKT